MNRPKYKYLYFREKSNKETYLDTLNKIIETLKTFNDIQVKDKVQDVFSLEKARFIEIRQNDKFLQVVLNLSIMESEEENE